MLRNHLLPPQSLRVLIVMLLVLYTTHMNCLAFPIPSGPGRRRGRRDGS